MKTLIRQVVRIEAAENKNGKEYTRAIVQSKSGEQKLPLFGDLADQIKTPGTYKIQYEDEGQFWKAVSAELQSETTGLAVVAGNGPKSLKNDLQGHQNAKDREIRGAVILKACSEYLAAIAARGRLDAPAGSTDSHAMEAEAHHAFKVFQTLLEAYVADKQPDFEKVPF